MIDNTIECDRRIALFAIAKIEQFFWTLVKSPVGSIHGSYGTWFPQLLIDPHGFLQSFPSWRVNVCVKKMLNESINELMEKVVARVIITLADLRDIIAATSSTQNAQTDKKFEFRWYTNTTRM